MLQRSLLVVVLLTSCLAASTLALHDSLFYCDTAATVLGSEACQIFSDIDPRFPVSVEVLPSGLPIIFYAPTPPIGPPDSFIPMRYIICRNVECTEVDQPRDLDLFNGLFGVDALHWQGNGTDFLIVGAQQQVPLFLLDNFYDIESANPLYWPAVGALVNGTDFEVHQVIGVPDIANTRLDSVLARWALLESETGEEQPVLVYYTRTKRTPYGLWYGTDGANNYEHKTAREEQENLQIGLDENDQEWYWIRLMIVSVTYAGPGTWFTSGVTETFPAARALSNFHGDFPWSNNAFGFYQEEFNERMGTSSNSPFAFNIPIPSLHVHTASNGNVYVGVQSMQRLPLNRLRGTDLCYFEETSPSQPMSVFGSHSWKFNPVTQNIFSGTTNLQHYLLQSNATQSATVPHASSPFQYNGLSSTQSLKLADSFGMRLTEPESPTCPPVGGPVPARSARKVGATERYLGSDSTIDEFFDETAKSLPHTLASGLAGNGFPAVLGIVTSTTGEPSASGWSLVLTVCVTEDCEQQVSRYVMDSSSLHDNWGIMDDPFASVNSLLNHPDGTLTIVLFVQPQGEQVSRGNNITQLRGEGSSGKPLFITCMDDTCASAFVSATAPNRLQTSMPIEYYSKVGGPSVINRPHTFTFVGEDSESLLVTVRDLPLSGFARSSPSAYSPVGVRFWLTNRYASPAGSPCSSSSVGSTSLVDSTLYICTRLNVGHDLTLGGISGWIRYYEWVDVGHSFAARLWANLPAARSPLGFSDEYQNN